MDTRSKKEALDALLDLRSTVATGGQDGSGICCNSSVVLVDQNTLVELFMRWPEYSGNADYPVPHKSGANAGYWDLPCQQGLEARRDYMWGESAYGQARRRLLDFCIAELQRELAPPITSKSYKPAHGGYPDANHDAIKATTPTTCCPCGQVPVCHGLRTCGKSSA